MNNEKLKGICMERNCKTQKGTSIIVNTDVSTLFSSSSDHKKSNNSEKPLKRNHWNTETSQKIKNFQQKLQFFIKELTIERMRKTGICVMSLWWKILFLLFNLVQKFCWKFKSTPITPKKSHSTRKFSRLIQMSILIFFSTRTVYSFASTNWTYYDYNKIYPLIPPGTLLTHKQH